MSDYYGEIRKGAVILPPDCPLPDGQIVRIVPVEEKPPAPSSPDQPLPLDAQHPACGMWADRDEMAESVSYSRMVREGLARRNPHG